MLYQPVFNFKCGCAHAFLLSLFTVCAFLFSTFTIEAVLLPQDYNVVQMKVDLDQMKVEPVPVRKVHVIFMNHLDVGYYDGRDNETGLAVQVLNRYLTEYFERAINISRTLVDRGYVERFVYTTQPWLVSLFLDCPNITLVNTPLKCPNATQIKTFKTAVKDGLIAWHAGPMNLQTDNLGGPLFEYGLDLSKSLDAMFGINRTHPVYSQRDVPGLTKAVIPALLSRGVKGISVGVNPGTAPPAVSSPFLWKFSKNSTDGIMFFQVKGGYPLNPGPDPKHPRGLARDKCHSVPGLDQVLCFAFRTDNTGPPVDVQEVLSYYEILRAEYPGADLVASTFDEFMKAAEPFKAQLPVYTFEMGDTWIQGIASDPKKTAMYRAFERTWVSCLQSGVCSIKDVEIQKMLRFLIKLPEHTWGAHYFLDDRNWTNSQLDIARKGDIYRRTEAAWYEQRQFLDYAMAALVGHPLADMIKSEYAKMEAHLPDLTDFEQVGMNQDFVCADGTTLHFTEDGSLSRLYDPYNKIEWATPDSRLGQLTYDTYTEQDFVHMAKLYNYEAGVGYDKPNVTKNAAPERKRWEIRVLHLYRRRSDLSCDLWLEAATTDPQTRSKYGAPRSFYVHFEQNKYTPGIDITLLTLGKVTTRLPESISVNFQPRGQGQTWMLDKMGVGIDPCHVVLNGSQYVHGVGSGVSFTNSNGQGLFFSTLDTPVVLIGTSNHVTSPFPVPLQPLSCSSITSVAFNVYNNIWNTNYIYYYPYAKEDADFKSRFSILFPN